MTERLELLIADAINKVKEKHVMVIGLGGVGGYALETIVRSGIGEVTIVDGDIIEESNINRQLIATTQTLGQSKTDAFAKRLHDINPNLIIHAISKFIEPDDIPNLFHHKVDYVIDCIDSLKTKQALISYLVNHDIKFISSMGTGNKLHPERLRIMKLKDTKYDAIAKRLRKYVKDNHINKDIYVVCSDEVKVTSHAKTIPSNAFVPAVAGLLCASYIFNDMIK